MWPTTWASNTLKESRGNNANTVGAGTLGRRALGTLTNKQQQSPSRIRRSAQLSRGGLNMDKLKITPHLPTYQACVFNVMMVSCATCVRLRQLSATKQVRRMLR